MKIKYILPVLFLLFSISDALAQLGSTHYIPPIHNSVGINEAYIYVSTPLGAPPTRPIDVTLSRPDGTIIAVKTIMRGMADNFNVGDGPGGSGGIILNTVDLSRIQNDKGLIVSSSDLIYVSLRLNVGAHAGYLTAKGEDALGTRFRVGSTELKNVGPGTTASFFAGIMATEDNTSVQFTHQPGVVFRNGPIPSPLILNAGETFTVSGYLPDSPNNATGFVGALIEATKPIVVNTGNLNSNLPNIGGGDGSTTGSDMMLDQIVDESLVGFEYMLVRGRGNDVLEQPMVIATVPNTQIFVNGLPVVNLVSPGDYAYLDPTLFQPATGAHRNMYVSSDPTTPFYMYQFLGGLSGGGPANATPGMIFVPPLSCFFQQEVHMIPDIDEMSPTANNYQGNIAITAFTGTAVTYNGGPTLTGALANPATTDWVTYLVPNQTTGNAIIEADGPIAVGYIGTDNGTAGFGGFYSGFAVIPVDTMTEICTLNGNVNLFDRIDGNPDPAAAMQNWVFLPNNGDPAINLTPPPADGSPDGIWDPFNFDPLFDRVDGAYRYTSMGLCAAVDVLVRITLVDSPLLDPLPDVFRCEGDSFTLADPATLTGTDLNAPQYFTDTQMSGTAVLIDWTMPITTVGVQRIYVYDEVTADPDACFSEISFDLTINATPVATVTDPVFCEDTLTFPITLTQTAGGTLDNYQIDYDAAANTAGFTDITAFTPLAGANFDIPVGVAPGVYNGTITYEDVVAVGVTCTGTDTFTITVNANPIATTNDVQVCQGITTEPIVITATTGAPTGYYIDYDPAAEAVGFTDAGTAMAPLAIAGANYAIPAAGAPGVYNGLITYLDGNGCTGTDAFTVEIFENPIATTNNVQVCQGVTAENIVITATTGTPINYVIDYDPAAEAVGFIDVTTPVTITGASYVIPALGTPGIYNGALTYVDANGCTGTDAFTIEIFANPVATTNDVGVCQGVTTEPIVLTATTGTPLNYFIDYDAAAEAQGFTDVADILTAVPIAGASYTIPALATPAIYNGTITYIDANGCLGTDPFTITINENPIATTNDVQVCQGITTEPIVITATTGAPTGYYIDYDPAAEAVGFTDAGTAMAPLAIAGANYAIPAAGAPGVYNGLITYLDVNGCTGTDAFTVEIFENPIATTNDVQVCQGVTAENIVITATTGTPINYFIDYDPGAEAVGFIDVADATTPVTIAGASYVIPALGTPGIYNGALTYVDANGCTGTDAFTIEIFANPVATTNDVAVCQGVTTEPIVLTATTGTPINYFIDYDAAAEAQGFTDVADILTAVPIAGASYTIPALATPAIYNGTITYIDTNGCLGTDPFTITINENPIATTNDVQVCQGITTEPIVITATTGAPTGYYIDYDPAAEAVGFTDAGTAMAPLAIAGANYAIPAAGAPGVYNGLITYLDGKWMYRYRCIYYRNF